MDRVRISKFLSWVLRHAPGELGLEPDAGGWVRLDDLLEAARRHGRPLERGQVRALIEGSDEQRFELGPDGRRIRARYGHSIPVDLELEPEVPPERLFHGTAERFVESIRDQGLRPRSRLWVHLSPDRETARRVGGRHGRAVVLVVRARDLHREGHPFYRPTDEVWLTDRVPPGYLDPTD